MKRRFCTLTIVGFVALGVAQRQSGPLQGQSSQPAMSRPVRHFDEALLSKPIYGVVMEVDVKVPMRDWVMLSTDIYRPDAPGMFPAILVRHSAQHPSHVILPIVPRESRTLSTAIR